MKTGENNDSNSSVLYAILIRIFIIGKFGAIKKAMSLIDVYPKNWTH